jgi:hypothetical protein
MVTESGTTTGRTCTTTVAAGGPGIRVRYGSSYESDVWQPALKDACEQVLSRRNRWINVPPQPWP